VVATRTNWSLCFGILTIPFFFLNVFAPVFVGGLIYALWRKSTLLFFSWFEYVGIDSTVFLLRSGVIGLGTLPDWLLFCLPDGLWVYAFTVFMAGLWKGYLGSGRFCFVCLGLALAIVGEIGQFFGLIQGTYDVLDVVFSLFGFLLAIFVVTEIYKGGIDESHRCGEGRSFGYWRRVFLLSCFG